MYKFVDTTERISGEADLPAEAMNINGRYIENEIKGYRTLHVLGRELLESEIKGQEIGNSDGEEFLYKRNISRTITVTYMLVADTPLSFREKFNKLSGILDVEEARLVFNDEPDKYYIGSKSTVSDTNSGAMKVTGSFDIYCSNPYKRSIAEKSFQAAPGSGGVMEMRIINNGTEAVPVDYTIKHNHENGYIGIVSEHGVIQLGYVDELDKEQRAKSETLFDYRKPPDYDAMTSGQAILGYDYALNGKWGAVLAGGGSQQWLTLADIGSGPTWHGAGKMVTIPSDSEGVSGSADFYVQAKIWFETGASDQTGMAELSVGDESGNHLASIRIAKYDMSRNIAYAIFDVAGVERQRISFAPAWDGPTASDKGHVYIDKKGESFLFYFAGSTFPVNAPEAAGRKAKTVSIFLGQHGTVPSSKLVTRMYFDYVFFRKDNVAYWVDIPNRYGANSVVYIDGGAKKVYVDGIPNLGGEIVGSNYPMAPPGETKVQFMYSGFSRPAPTISAKIREAYL